MNLPWLSRLRTAGAAHPIGRFRRGAWLKGLLLGLVVLGAKWAVVGQFAGEAPYNDQWNAEAVGLYAPIMRGEFRWDALFTSHNEHRIVLTKAWDVALFGLTGGQWDPRLQMVASAAIHAGWLGLLGVWLARGCRLAGTRRCLRCSR